MRVRLIGFLAAALLAVPVVWGPPSASAATAQFFVTGYVLRGYTATGTYVHPGTCAVDPRVIPLGTYFTIVGYGTCHAEDTGGAIIGYRVDVWVPTVAQADALTGWYTVTWGAPSTQQVEGFHASRSQTPPSKPVRRPQPARSHVPPAQPIHRPQPVQSHVPPARATSRPQPQPGGSYIPPAKAAPPPPPGAGSDTPPVAPEPSQSSGMHSGNHAPKPNRERP